MNVTTCQHGQSGYCHDDATPEQREHFEWLHSHAYAWASGHDTVDRDAAEAYATHYAGRYWDEDWTPDHRDEWRRWAA